MKKLCLLILICSILMLLPGCKNSQPYLPQMDVNYNFNNISADNSYFWLTNDALYYPYAPFMEINYYAAGTNGTSMIASAGNGAFARIQAYKNYVYMLGFGDTRQGDGSIVPFSLTRKWWCSNIILGDANGKTSKKEKRKWHISHNVTWD